MTTIEIKLETRYFVVQLIRRDPNEKPHIESPYAATTKQDCLDWIMKQPDFGFFGILEFEIIVPVPATATGTDSKPAE